jgi:hypothetical protein
MNQKPFTPNVEKKLEKLAETSKAVLAAMKALDEAMKSADNWTEHETIQSFRYELKEFLSSDHGEAGFAAYLTRKQERPYFDRRGRAIKVTIPD